MAAGAASKPKGAELTHHQLYVNCTANGQLFRFRDEDVSMSVLPMFHVFGLSSVLNVAVRFGGTLVLVPGFHAQTVVDELARRRCTIFSGVPTMYRALLQADTDGRDLSALRVGVSGDAAIAGEVIRAFEEKFPGVVIRDGYGLSETPSAPTESNVLRGVVRLQRCCCWLSASTHGGGTTCSAASLTWLYWESSAL